MSMPEPDADSIVMLEREQFKELLSVLRQICREVQELRQEILEDVN